MVKLIGGKRVRKQIRLSEHTIENIEQFAAVHSLNFGQAIEQLALIGLQDTKTLGTAELMATVVRQETARHYNRFAKLIVHAGLEAGAAKQAAQVSVFLQMLALAEEVTDPELLSDQYAADMDTAMGAEIARLFKKWRQAFRWRSVQELKKPLAEIHEIMAEFETESTAEGK